MIAHASSVLGGVAGAGSLLSAFTNNANAATPATHSQVSQKSKNRFTVQSEDLSPYTGTWGDTQLRHLLRRAMFGVPESQFLAAQQLGSMDAVVTQLLACQDLNKVPLPAKLASWVDNYTTNNPNLLAMENQEIVNWWFDQMIQENLSIRQKMTLMWTNHFVTGSQTVNLSCYMYYYLMMCMQYAVGNFENFALAISESSAMLSYLNGDQSYITSKVNNANVNFARELMELFTLGINFPGTDTVPNYTQTDIEEAARALTGWQHANKGQTPAAPFNGVLWNGTNGNPSWHDTTNKTFLGQTGNWGLGDVIRIIFQQPTDAYPPNAPSGFPQGYTSAYWACQKIYKTFVYYNPTLTDPNGTVRDAMARLMVQNSFEMAPVMQALLTSAHFYDPAVIGAQIKSPCQYMGSLVREFGLTSPAFDPTDPPPTGKTDAGGNPTYTDTNPTLTIITNRIMNNGLGQQLLNPPNVAGWPGGENWLSASSFQGRQNYSTVILGNSKGYQGISAFSPETYANQITNAGTLEESVLFSDLEDVSLAFMLGTTESDSLAPNPTKTDDVIGTDVPSFAVALSQLPEFQLF